MERFSNQRERTIVLRMELVMDPQLHSAIKVIKIMLIFRKLMDLGTIEFCQKLEKQKMRY